MQIQELARRWGPTYLFTQRAHNKDYSFAGQETILENTAKYGGIDKSRPTLNRDLRELEDAGYLHREQRTKHHKIYGMMHNSTMCFLGMKMYHALARMGINVTKEINHLIAKLRFKYPEFAVKSTKKMLEASKRNAGHDEFMRGIGHDEFMRGIVEKLVKLPVIE
jgi:DNA-binding transcriptional ArsR family regulator